MNLSTVFRIYASLPFIQARRVKACCKEIESAGFWFVDIPRTSSTSLKLALGQRFGTEFGKQYARETGVRTQKVIPDHATAIEMRKLLSPELWSRLFTFSVVRNPWDRCYSLFRFRIAMKAIPASFPFPEYLSLLEQRNTRHRYSPFRY